MILLVLAVAYLIGSIPFALFIGHIGTGGDIRNMGSGNAGATNVMRILGWKAALIVLSGDFLKGFLPVFFAWKIYDAVLPQRLSLIGFQIALMIFLILGHVFPLWAGFRGGEGCGLRRRRDFSTFSPSSPFLPDGVYYSHCSDKNYLTGFFNNGLVLTCLLYNY